MGILRDLDFPSKRIKPYITFLGFFLVLAIGGLDNITSYDISVSLLYLFPIMLVAWFEGGALAALISIFSAVTWAVSDLASGHMYSSIAVPLWNAAMVLGMFLIVAYSISAMKKLLKQDREHAVTDDLTGATNVGYFYERALAEIRRSGGQKASPSLAYIRIDDLSRVNDAFGHIAGDYLLHEAAQIIRSTVRETDVVSRLGGAKFAVLMPKTKNDDATGMIRTTRERLFEMTDRKGWPVKFRVGIVACPGPTCTMDQFIKMAEDRMSVDENDHGLR